MSCHAIDRPAVLQRGGGGRLAGVPRPDARRRRHGHERADSEPGARPRTWTPEAGDPGQRLVVARVGRRQAVPHFNHGHGRRGRRVAAGVVSRRGRRPHPVGRRSPATRRRSGQGNAQQEQSRQPDADRRRRPALYVHFGHMGTAALDLKGKVLWTANGREVSADARQRRLAGIGRRSVGFQLRRRLRSVCRGALDQADGA